MTNKYASLNIITRLDFSNLSLGTIPASFNDTKEYNITNLTKYLSPTIIQLNPTTNALNLVSNGRIYTTSTYDVSDYINNNFQFSCNFILRSLKPKNILVSLDSSNNASFNIHVKNTLKDGICIEYGTKTLACNYLFAVNTDYNISVIKLDNVYRMLVNDVPVGFINPIDGIEFDSYISMVASRFIIGSNKYSVQDGSTLAFDGTMYNIAISYGVTLHYEPLKQSSYSGKLISYLNLTNSSSLKTVDYYPSSKETVGIINWTLPAIAISSGDIVLSNSEFSTSDLVNAGPYKIEFKLTQNQSLSNVKIVDIENKYVINLTTDFTGSYVAPKPIVIAQTKAALDFENGLTDLVPGTVWTTEGSPTIIDNGIFGKSYKTNATADSLYLPSNTLTGGSTPFTIEFYVNINPTQSIADDGLVLVSQTVNVVGGEQELAIDKTRGLLYFTRNTGNTPGLNGSDYLVKHKIKFNETNKITFSYDGSASRIFVDDIMAGVIGIASGWNVTNQPLRFLDSNVPVYSSARRTNMAIIDNINIHDGIATRVRSPDPYESYLAVDLAFDGENNSTTIIDNGSLLSTWTVSGASKLSTTQSFDGFSSLNGRIYTEGNLPILTGDFTFSVEIYITDLSAANGIFATAYDNGTVDVEQYFLLSVGSSVDTLGRANKIYCRDAQNRILFISPTTVLINAFYKISLVRSGSLVYMYLNGKLDSTATLTKSIDLLGTGTFVVGSPHKTSTDEILKGYIKNFKLYDGAAVIPTGYKTLNTFNASISSTKLISNINWNTTNAIFADDSFTGYLIDYSGNSAFSFYGSDFDMMFAFKGYGNIVKEWSGNLRFNVGIESNGVVTFKFYEAGPTQQQVTSGASTILSTVNYLRISRINGSFYMSLNDIAYNITSPGPYTTSVYGPTTEGVTIGDTTMTTYSISVTKHFYYGSNVQLDFDNDVIDKYNNSTWTNNGATFDNVNSVRGYSAYFGPNSETVYTAVNTNFNYGQSNFHVNMDIKPTEDRQYSTIFNSRTTNGTNNGAYIARYVNGGIGKIACGINNPSNVAGFELGSQDIINLNTYYNVNMTRNAGAITLRVNDVISITMSNVTTVVDFSYGAGTQLGHGWGNNYATNKYVGYIDNFKSIKDYHEDAIIDRPAVHLPLETNPNNITYIPLTITPVGSPTYTTIDGKKCILFEAGKYLTINSNNVFNLGTSTDFYMELDFYPPAIHTNGYGHSILNNGLDNSTDGMWLQYLPMTMGADAGKIEYVVLHNNTLVMSHRTSNTLNVSTWNNLKFYRISNSVYIDLNGVITQFQNDINLNFSLGNTHLGMIYNVSTLASMDGYLSNFKLFVGSSVVPSSYNDKKILDLDFKPTNKSYLFKDNNNKCIIHPVNIVSRDFINGQYACTFNGTNQYLQLGKNDALNFGFDDFVIEFEYLKSSYDTSWECIMHNNSSNNNNRVYIEFSPSTHSSPNKIEFAISDSYGAFAILDSVSDYPINERTKITIIRSSNTLKMYINGILDASRDISTSPPINLNYGGDTNIGRTPWPTDYATFSLFSLKILRNTNDLGLLNSIQQAIESVTSTYSITDINNNVTSDSIVTTNKTNSVSVIKTIDSLTLTVDNNSTSISTDTSVYSPTVKLFSEYSGLLDPVVKTYSYDESVLSVPDTYVTPPLAQLAYPEIEIISNDDSLNLLVEDVGDYIIRGFIEGHSDHSYAIYNKVLNYSLIEGIGGDYFYDGINGNYKEDYEVRDYTSGQRYPLLDHDMVMGYLEILINNVSDACIGGDFCVRLYRRDTQRFIGEYDFNEFGICRIDYLDCESRYDALLFDRNTIFESRMMSDRTPSAS